MGPPLREKDYLYDRSLVSPEEKKSKLWYGWLSQATVKRSCREPSLISGAQRGWALKTAPGKAHQALAHEIMCGHGRIPSHTELGEKGYFL
jgi:hypothetical protein